MPSKEVTLELCRRHILQAIPPVIAIYAYGSRILGTAHPESDLDLALLMPRGERLPAILRAQLQGDLESLLGFPVDITVLDPEMQLVHCKEVVSSGEVIYRKEGAAVAAFEMQVLSAYARFCEDRKPVVEAFAGGGDG
jgi:predicted nucleotidyltransferase